MEIRFYPIHFIMEEDYSQNWNNRQTQHTYDNGEQGRHLMYQAYCANIENLPSYSCPNQRTDINKLPQFKVLHLCL